MKTLLSIAVGLMILLSSVIVEAAPPAQKTTPAIYTITVVNKDQKQSLTYFKYYKDPNPNGVSTSFQLPTVGPNAVGPNVTQNFKVKIAPNARSLDWFKYGYHENDFCRFHFNVRNYVGYVLHIENAGDSKGIAICNVTQSGNNIVINMSRVISMFCVRNILFGEYVPDEEKLAPINITAIKDGVSTKTISIAPNETHCWDYNKHIIIDYDGMMTASANSLSRNGKIQRCLINRVNMNSAVGDISCDYPIRSIHSICSSFKKGNIIIVKTNENSAAKGYSFSVKPHCMFGGTFSG